MRTQLQNSGLGLCLLALLMGCATTSPQPAGDTEHFEFAGTGWRLVQIRSMDDSVFTPAERMNYTLVFDADGTATLRADCNRGSGSWSSQGPNQLQFGPIATTRALCAPGSLSERYLTQFEWIRSYVARDGNLFLATLADGAIIEFEPLPSN